MKEHGFVRVAACVPVMSVADVTGNAEKMIGMIGDACKEGAAAVVFPELALTGYTCADLFNQKVLIDEAEKAVSMILEKTADIPVVSIIGLPVEHEGQLFNAACVICSGKLLGICAKTYLPNYSEFYEKRWFSSAHNIVTGETVFLGMEVPVGNDLVFHNTLYRDLVFSAEICEDLWAPIPPSTFQAMGGASIIFNLSASNELIGKADYRKGLVKSHSGKTVTGYVYVSAGIGESSTDTVYGGHTIISEYGQILAESERFSNESMMTLCDLDLFRLMHNRKENSTFIEYPDRKKMRHITYSCDFRDNHDTIRTFDRYPFVPGDKHTLDKRCAEIFGIQTSGLYKRLKYTGAKKAVVGISGGLDSTLALLVTKKAMDKLGKPEEDIIAVTMPGFGTSDTTYRNAVELIGKIGAEKRKIPIIKACRDHFKSISHDPGEHDTVFENVQARERTMLLMNMANKEKGLVIGTGDLSEIALGWSTYNGDHMSMYAVNCGIPKTLVKFLVEWIAENEADAGLGKVLKKIVDTPISPELLPPDAKGNISQKTEDVIGPYELHDFFLYYMLRYGAGPAKISYMAQKAFKGYYSGSEIKKWLRIFYTRFFQSQYKRSCIPDGPKVGTIALSPRADWRMPSDAEARIWLDALGDL